MGISVATGIQPGKSTEWEVKDGAKTNNAAVSGAKGEAGEAAASYGNKQVGREPCTCSVPPPNRAAAGRKASVSPQLRLGLQLPGSSAIAVEAWRAAEQPVTPSGFPRGI